MTVRVFTTVCSLLVVLTVLAGCAGQEAKAPNDGFKVSPAAPAAEKVKVIENDPNLSQADKEKYIRQIREGDLGAQMTEKMRQQNPTMPAAASGK